VEVPERQRKLDKQRTKREPRAMPDVRPEPLHAAMRLASEGQGIPMQLMICCNLSDDVNGGKPPNMTESKQICGCGI
jgi:hypothetical protein